MLILNSLFNRSIDHLQKGSVSLSYELIGWSVSYFTISPHAHCITRLQNTQGILKIYKSVWLFKRAIPRPANLSHCKQVRRSESRSNKKGQTLPLIQTLNASGCRRAKAMPPQPRGIGTSLDLCTRGRMTFVYKYCDIHSIYLTTMPSSISQAVQRKDPITMRPLFTHVIAPER